MRVNFNNISQYPHKQQPSFEAMKKSQFLGVSRIVVEKYKLPIEKFNVIESVYEPENAETIYAFCIDFENFLSWECDLAFWPDNKYKPINYMFVINVNTKFLYVIYLANKTENEMIDAFMNLFHAKSANVQTPEGLRINNLRFDGESALNSKLMQQFYKQHNIKCYSNSSPYINKNRVVDRVIRTIRTAIDNYMFNNGIEHLSVASHRKLMRQIVAIYNNTKHNSTGLKPIEMTFQQELDYIKNKERELKLQMAKQDQNGLLNYEPDDELLIYLPSGKTDKFSKKHIYYSTPAIFIKYSHGNVIAQLEDESIVEVPVYYTRRA